MKNEAITWTICVSAFHIQWIFIFLIARIIMQRDQGWLTGFMLLLAVLSILLDTPW